VIGACLALLALAAQQPATFSVGVEAVYVDVFVSDDDRPLLGLTAEDFELKNDGVRERVELVGVEEAPLATHLVLDRSSSVSGAKLAALQAAVRELLRGLSAGDEAALVAFDHQVRTLVPRTSELPRLLQAVDRLRPGGATALYDALYAGSLLASERGRALLVLFTDGEDNMSWLDAARVRRVLEESNVLAQAVGVVPAPPAQVLADGRRREPPETTHARTLRQLAEATGGRFWPAANHERLGDAFREMLQAMKTRYVLRFEPQRGRREGRHELAVKLVRRKGRVHCRKAYFVGPQAR
jgi:VWFA-related protein